MRAKSVGRMLLAARIAPVQRAVRPYRGTATQSENIRRCAKIRSVERAKSKAQLAMIREFADRVGCARKL